MKEKRKGKLTNTKSMRNVALVDDDASPFGLWRPLLDEFVAVVVGYPVISPTEEEVESRRGGFAAGFGNVP